MPQNKIFSDEFLNAFVDDQLTAEEKSQAYLRIGQDQTLNREVCELRKVQDLVRLAYRDIPLPAAGHPSTPRRAGLGLGIAATLLLALGIVLGTQLAPSTPERAAPMAEIAPTTAASPPAATAPRQAVSRPAPTVATTAPAATVNPAPTAVHTAAAEIPATSHPQPATEAAVIPPRATGQARNKVLIHIAHDDPRRLSQALEEIGGLLRHYRDTRQSAHVEVVVNGRGLELVRIETSRHAEQIRRLQHEYDNLTFAACQNTIDRLGQEQGITVRLLPGVTVIDSGMAEIMRRQNQGWTYLQV